MSLFDKDDRYTQDASDLDHEIGLALQPIMIRYANKGHSIREIQYIASMAAMDVALMRILEKPNDKPPCIPSMHTGVTIPGDTFRQGMSYLKQALEKPDNKAARALGLSWLTTLKGWEPIHCICGQKIDTTDGGKANSGIYCTECGRIFCDNCYDTGKGDGCKCHVKIS